MYNSIEDELFTPGSAFRDRMQTKATLAGWVAYRTHKGTHASRSDAVVDAAINVVIDEFYGLKKFREEEN